ncbi:hypothetical protein ACFQRL_01605 [Microbacterium fluvii]|uniref:Uncharacterized protein n=1 Tax=Microbacterium fluvii TaxID=415215 RepID=A0ABW2HCP9_9MICO|nr:hypothetical protein [Microbacterium fluvii]MCU4671283.1 hypothetical protein [Microbacterium fluvii]
MSDIEQTLELNAQAPDEATDAAPDDDTALPRPRIRWAGIVWGAVFAAIALIALRTLGDPGSRTAAMSWIETLDAGSAVAYGLLGMGALVLVTGLVGLLRHAQRRAARP